MPSDNSRTTLLGHYTVLKYLVWLLTLSWAIPVNAQTANNQAMQSIFDETQQIAQELLKEGYQVSTVYIDQIDSLVAFYPTLPQAKDVGVFAIGNEQLTSFQLAVRQQQAGRWQSLFEKQLENEEQNFILMSIPWQENKRYRLDIRRLAEAESQKAYFGLVLFYD
ncbi:MAG: hypothetical protein ACFB0B_07010 [Thermonemataceae bacterium]